MSRAAGSGASAQHPTAARAATSRWIVLCATTCLGLVGAAATTGTTYASGSADRTGADLVQVVTLGERGSTLLPFEVERLYPGSSVQERFVLRRGAGFEGGSFALTVLSVADVERGCERPERRAGDTSCHDGDDQGELSQQLLVGHAWSDDATGCASASPPATGRAMAEIEDVLLTAPASLEADDEICLVLGISLPPAADNRVQGDLVRFDLRLGLADATVVPEPPARGTSMGGTTQQAGSGASGSGAGGAAPVIGGQAAAGAEGASGAPASTRPALLPFTGTPLRDLVLGAGALAALGVLLLRCGSRRPRT